LRWIGQPVGKLGRRKRSNDAHEAVVTVWTEVSYAGPSGWRRSSVQVGTAELQKLGTVAIGEQAEVADAHKPGG